MPVAREQPAECARLETVETAGASALEIMERQHAAILRYEAKVKACAEK